MLSRIAVGRAAVVRELRSAAPLMAALRAPVTARAPWSTAVLNQGAGPRPPIRPVAVVVEPHRHGDPSGVAFLTLRRRGMTTAVTLLGDAVLPLPGGSPPFRLLVRDQAAAVGLADGIQEVLRSLYGPWTLQLSGLPLGDPTLAALAERLPTAVLANRRSHRLVDELGDGGQVERSRDPAVLERRLPAFLAREPDQRARHFLRSAARLHAAIGQVEVAVVADGNDVRAAVLTLVDRADRRVWWGSSDIGGLRTELGSPVAGLTAPARGWPPGQRSR